MKLVERITSFSLLFVSATLITASTGLALELDPGEWEFTTVSHAPMAPAPRTETRTECVVNGSRSADEFLANMEECTVSDLVDNATTMSYKVKCPNGPLTLNGTADMKSDGKTVNGKMAMSMDMEGQSMSMTIDWSGKRLGDCK